MIHLLAERDQAIGFLEKTYEDRDGYNLAFIKVDPFFDPLRCDPRFEALVAKFLRRSNEERQLLPELKRYGR